MIGRRWVEVAYRCRCFSKDAIVQVKERDVGEDVESFMGRVMVSISDDHRSRSPLCTSTKTVYAKFQVGDGGKVGGAVGGVA